MTKERQGEIALLLIKNQIKTKGITFGSRLHREIGNQAKDIGIEKEEATEFIKTVLDDLMEETFKN